MLPRLLTLLLLVSATVGYSANGWVYVSHGGSANQDYYGETYKVVFVGGMPPAEQHILLSFSSPLSLVDDDPTHVYGDWLLHNEHTPGTFVKYKVFKANGPVPIPNSLQAFGQILATQNPG